MKQGRMHGKVECIVMLLCGYKVHGWKYILFPNVILSATRHKVETLLLMEVFEEL